MGVLGKPKSFQLLGDPRASPPTPAYLSSLAQGAAFCTSRVAEVFCLTIELVQAALPPALVSRCCSTTWLSDEETSCGVGSSRHFWSHLSAPCPRAPSRYKGHQSPQSITQLHAQPCCHPRPQSLKLFGWLRGAHGLCQVTHQKESCGVVPHQPYNTRLLLSLGMPMDGP